MIRILVPFLLLLAACSSDTVERPTNEETQRLNDIENMLDEG